jgi:hypothetical protein
LTSKHTQTRRKWQLFFASNRLENIGHRVATPPLVFLGKSACFRFRRAPVYMRFSIYTSQANPFCRSGSVIHLNPH